MLNHRIIHETVIRDILDLAEGIKDSDEIQAAKNMRNGTSFKSITAKSEALTLVFPVIASKNMNYTTAAMIAKAIERKAVTMLHMLFAASNISDAKDGIDYLSRFHTNLRTSGALTVDDFINTMDALVEECGLLTEATQIEEYEAVKRDVKNLNFYLENPLNETSLQDYKMIHTEAGDILVHEYNNDEDPEMRQLKIRDYNDRHASAVTNLAKASFERNNANRKYELDIKNSEENQKRAEFDRQATVAKMEYQRQQDKISNKYRNDTLAMQKTKTNSDIAKTNMDMRKAASDITKSRIDMEKNRLMDYDVKKANELMPTMMYVNFVTIDNQSKYPIESTMVIGVKAKLYAIDADDIMNRIKIKHSDRNLLLNLVKASTREISFFRDFMFAIDRAKIDAISQSNRGSSNKIWKILERRALKSKMRRSFFMTNDATAITTLVISQDDVEYLKKTEYINVEDPRVIRPVLDAYNLMGFVIVDESLEIAKFIFDTGDDMYEVLTFDNLEREQKDNSKKIINLMSKMNR